jgi:hypothetical protein
LFDALVAQLEVRENSELVNGISIGEEQFARGAFKTLEEAQIILKEAWQGLGIEE